MSDMTWVEWPKDLSAQRRWKALFHGKDKDQTEMNVIVLKPTKNSSLCSRQFDKEKIRNDNYMSEPVFFDWNNGMTPLLEDRKGCCSYAHHVLRYSGSLY